ncbi:alpha/beta fold hydrolase, partial [Candidatus Sumerlaeota bacterium]|nr:alpha/beta fold hydrolase [Candidatus Sumerlaeota bacterium]
HGPVVSAKSNWMMPGIVAKLAKDHRVIAPDLRGHGQSDAPETVDQYGMKLVEDMIGLLDHLKIAKAHVVGYSLGSVVAAKFASLHPDRTLSLAIGGMGWFNVENGQPLHLGPAPPEKKKKALEAAFDGYLQLQLSKEEMQKLTCPVTVFIAEKDPIMPLYVEPLKKLRPDIPVVTVTGANHMNCFMKEQYQEGLQDFIAGAHKPKLNP